MLSNLFKSYIVLIFCAVATSVSAQKIKKEKFGYFNYIQPRASSVLNQLEYYSLEVEITEDDAYRRKMIEKELTIKPFKSAGIDNTPEFTIKIIESPFKFKTPVKKNYQEKYKFEGEDKMRTMYFYEGTMGYHYLMKVLDASGNEIFREISKGVEKTKGRNAESQIQAMDQYVKDKYQSKDLAVKKVSDQLSDAFNNYFNDLKKTVQIGGFIITEKEFKYEEFNTASANLLRCYNLLNVTMEGTEETDDLLKNSVQLLNEFLKASTPTEKKSRVNAKITAATHYKLGLAHFMSRDFKQAQSAFEQAASFDKSVVPGILNWIYLSKTCAERLENH